MVPDQDLQKQEHKEIIGKPSVDVDKRSKSIATNQMKRKEWIEREKESKREKD